MNLDPIWPQVSAHLQPALEFGMNTHRLEDVRALVENGVAQLWPMPGGSIVTEILEMPSGEKTLRYWLAGGRLEALLMAEPGISEWARVEHGCSSAEIIGRRGWKKVLPQYRHVADQLWRRLAGDA